MKTKAPFLIALVLIILTGIQVQMFVLQRDTIENRQIITQQTEILGDVVDYLTGFEKLGEK